MLARGLQLGDARADVLGGVVLGYEGEEGDRPGEGDEAEAQPEPSVVAAPPLALTAFGVRRRG